MKALKILVMDDDEALSAVIQHILDGEDMTAEQREMRWARIGFSACCGPAW